MEAEDINYRVSYRDVKYPRLEFKTGKLLLVLPHGQNPDEIAGRHSDWINSKLEFIRASLEDSVNKEVFERDEGEFRDLVHTFSEKISDELDVSINKIVCVYPLILNFDLNIWKLLSPCCAHVVSTVIILS